MNITFGLQESCTLFTWSGHDGEYNLQSNSIIQVFCNSRTDGMYNGIDKHKLMKILL